MKQVFLVISFFIITPITLIFTLLTLQLVANPGSKTAVLGISQNVVYAALPSTQNTVTGIIVPSDSRVASLTSFFAKYNSPLLPYAQRFVDDADEYGLDYRLVPAIAFQESLLCNKALSQSPYNCYGWGITKHNVMTFSSYEEGIDTVTRSLAAWGTTTVEEVGQRYNPTNTNNWVENVKSTMNFL